jgi:hypothetical protein
MFLNIRLLVVAILAAVAGISCGLGLFATFRVNHEPLARLTDGGPPLQLAFDNRNPDSAPPIAAQFPLNGGTKQISIPLLIPIPGPAMSGEDSSGPDAASAKPEAAEAAEAANAEQADDLAGGTGEPKDDILAALPDAQSTDPSTEPDQRIASAVAAVDQQALQPIAEDSAASAVTAAVDEKATPAKPAAERRETAAKPKARDVRVVKVARTVRAAAQPRRAKVVRVRRTPTAVAAQTADPYAVPFYQASQWTDPNAQAQQTVRRVVIKRHRAPKTAAPAAQSSLAGATAGVFGTQ